MDNLPLSPVASTAHICDTAPMTTETLRQSDFVQRAPVFYGWVVWFAATVGVIATAPGQSFSVSLFIDHYITDFGLDRTSVSGLYSIGTFIAALALTWVGRRIDRQGNRRMSIIIAGLFGVVLLACSLVVGPFTILISFIAIRGLGQGSLGLVSTTAIAQWFQRRRGFMVGLSLVAFALFQRIYLPWMQDYITTYGWRAAWILSGVTLLLLVTPLLGLLIRDRPEDFGLQPDGGPMFDESGMAEDLPFEENWTLSEALRTPVMWAFTFGRVLVAAWGTALIFHQISIFAEQGFDAQVATATVGTASIVTAIFTFIGGWLLDRIQPGVVIALQMAGLIVACILAATMNSDGLLFAYALAFGAFMGIGSVFDGTVWVTLFGRQNQGAIRGFVTTSMVAGTSLGPVIFGFSFDNLGGYGPAIILGIVLAALAAAVALLVRLPDQRPTPA